MADLFRSPFLAPYAVPYGLPGGAYVPPAAPWTPEDLTGTLLWLDPRKHAGGLGMASTDTLSVAAATDFSGSGDLMQATASKRPLLRFDEGRWSYEFDGVDDYLERVVSLTNVPFSVLFAWRSIQTSQSPNSAVFASAEDGVTARSFQYDFDGTVWRLATRNNAGTANVLLPGPASSLTPNLVCIDAAAGGPQRLRVSETSYGDAGPDPTGGTLDRFRFGGNRGPTNVTGPSVCCQMRLFGAIILDHQATDSERLRIEQYFNQQASMGLSL